MTPEELSEAQLLLGKAAILAVVEILQGEGNKVVVQPFHFVEDEPSASWKMTIEKVKD